MVSEQPTVMKRTASNREQSPVAAAHLHGEDGHGRLPCIPTASSSLRHRCQDLNAMARFGETALTLYYDDSGLGLWHSSMSRVLNTMSS